MELNSDVNWEPVAEIYHPDEAQLICGLLETAGITVKLERETAGGVFGLNVGPLARIEILVPRDRLTEAQAILAAGCRDLEEPM
jgi:hypothetical protein